MWCRLVFVVCCLLVDIYRKFVLAVAVCLMVCVASCMLPFVWCCLLVVCCLSFLIWCSLFVIRVCCCLFGVCRFWCVFLYIAGRCLLSVAGGLLLVV